MIVFGTRPEAIKMCPLILELQKRKNIEVYVCVTGQHKEMLEQVLKVFNIPVNENLNIMKDKQNLFDVTQNILARLEKVLVREKPELVLVHGDTTTTFSTALACFYLHIPLGHVEAGLRTYNLESPFPEEFNRHAVSIIAKYNFAPTKQAKSNLIQEGIDENNIWVTGNTVIDALKITIKKHFQHEELDWASGCRLILMTAHRRENIGKCMYQMFRAIRRIMEDYSDVKIVYPVHMNPEIRKIANEELENNNKIHLCEPMDVVSFHNVMSRSYLILTDSGGIQEEASALGIPVLVMRDTTERFEGVTAGILRVVGTDEKNIYENCKMLLDDRNLYENMAKSENPYGNGEACVQIANIIEDFS